MSQKGRVKRDKWREELAQAEHKHARWVEKVNALEHEQVGGVVCAVNSSQLWFVHCQDSSTATSCSAVEIASHALNVFMMSVSAFQHA